MHGNPALRLRVPLEHRKVDDPQWPPSFLHQLHVLTDLDTQRANGVVHDLRTVSTEEHDVIVLSARALENAGNSRITQELHDGRLQSIATLGPLVDLDIRESLGAIPTDKRRVLINLRPRQRAGPGT